MSDGSVTKRIGLNGETILDFELPRGAKGDKGDKGDDGANVLPTDTAVANAITTNGTATKTALNAAIVGRYEVSAREFGITGTGDETAKLQTFINYLAANGKAGVLPDREYHISSTLTIPVRPEWSLCGVGSGSTKIIQDTDNIPVINLGGTVEGITSTAIHTYRLERFSLGYKNNQPATNTNANCILVSSMPYEGVWDDIKFINGYYASKVATGIGAPWGMTFDNLMFTSGLTGGAFDWSTAINGVPNNRFGRMYVDGPNMIGPVFTVRGYNFTVDTIEFIAMNQSPVLFYLAAGGRVDIGSMKIENGIYAQARDLFNFDVNSYARIGHLTVTGHTMQFNTGNCNIIRAGTGARVDVDFLDLTPSQVNSAVYGFNATNGRVSVRRYLLTAPATGLHNNNSTATADNLIVHEQVDGRLSPDKGDADYTVALGDPNIVHFGTALTAPRTITLPTDGNRMFNGLYYEFVISGAVNGANTMTIKAGTTTLQTQTADKVILRYTWRRHTTAANGWLLTKYETLP